MKTTHNCPACNMPLHSRTEDGTTIVYCGYGRCPSGKADIGIKGNQGETLDELAAKLIAELENNPDWPE